MMMEELVLAIFDLTLEQGFTRKVRNDLQEKDRKEHS